MNKRKLLLKIINNYKNVSFDDFIVIIEAFGFRRKRIKGSHNIFENSKINETINIQNVKGQAKPYQIKQFFEIVEKYRLYMEE